MPSFHGKGKITPMKFDQSISERFLDAFKNLSEKKNLMELHSEVIEEFVTANRHLYGYKKETDIHRVLALHFESKCKPKKTGKPLDTKKCRLIKGFCVHAVVFRS